MAYGTSVVVLLTARFVMGTGVGLAYPAARRIVILADPDRLGQNLGRMLAADVAGFAVGPAISAVLVGPFGIAAPFLLIAALTVACYPLVARTRVVESGTETEVPPRFAFDLLRIRPYLAALAMGSAVFMMIGAFDSLWALVLDDLRASDLIANLGITLFAVPMVAFASIGGRLAQSVGPFRLGTFGLLVGASAMFAYGHAPSGVVMLLISLVHATNDGFTVSSCGVAVGLVVPGERQASAQGLLGGAQTLVAGITATVIGQIYQHFGRTVAYTSCSAAMLALIICGALLSGSSWRLRDATDRSTIGVFAATPGGPETLV
jgi:MFS family permease